MFDIKLLLIKFFVYLFWLDKIDLLYNFFIIANIYLSH